uniref:Uncharacterized protein n=1 Tax=Leersia perrieri TaxID=77586 RepID=A0A0D9W064_9ORYZ
MRRKQQDKGAPALLAGDRRRRDDLIDARPRTKLTLHGARAVAPDRSASTSPPNLAAGLLFALAAGPCSSLSPASVAVSCCFSCTAVEVVGTRDSATRERWREKGERARDEEVERREEESVVWMTTSSSDTWEKWRILCEDGQ